MEAASSIAAPTRILVPVDLSRRSERGIEYAALLAERFGAAIVLFTNVTLAERVAIEEYAAAEGLSIADAAHALLIALGHRYAPDLDVAVDVRFEEHPGEGILGAASRGGVDAIVMASHGRSGMNRWWLGSVAEKILRSADVPVTIIPYATADPHQPSPHRGPQ